MEYSPHHFDTYDLWKNYSNQIVERPTPSLFRRVTTSGLTKNTLHSNSLTWKWKMAPWMTIFLYKHWFSTSMSVGVSVQFFWCRHPRTREANSTSDHRTHHYIYIIKNSEASQSAFFPPLLHTFRPSLADLPLLRIISRVAHGGAAVILEALAEAQGGLLRRGRRSEEQPTRSETRSY